MKRCLSVLLAVVMLLALCVPVAQATPISELRYHQKPTDPVWSPTGDLLWESDYFANKPDQFFRGFQIQLQYTTDDVNNVASPNWIIHPDSDEEFEYHIQTPNMGDFSVPVNGWYRFKVCAFGEDEGWGNAQGYAYWYYSEWSDWSEPKYFTTASPLDAPTDVHWEGTSMVFTMEDTSNVEDFWYQVYYTEVDENGETRERTINAGSYPVYRNQTKYILSLEDRGINGDTLLRYGTQNYRFKVQACSANKTIATDSEFVHSSNTLDVNAEAEKLPTPTGLYWDGYTMKWPVTQGATYQVELYFRGELSEEEKEELGQAGGSLEMMTPRRIETYTGITGQGDFPRLDNSVLENRPGDYFFKVRAISGDLTLNINSDWSDLSGAQHMEGLFTLPSPTDLKWSADGTASWSWTGTADQQNARRTFFMRLYYHETESSEGERLSSYVGSKTTATTEWRAYVEKDGWYSFDVYASSNDNNAYRNSDPSVRSGLFYYDAPDPLPAPTGLKWEKGMPTWSAPVGGTDLIEGYYLDLYYYGTDGTAEEQYVFGYSVEKEETSGVVTDEDFARRGEGVYKFKVRALSADTGAVSNSDYATSPVLTYVKPSEALPAPTGLCWDGAMMKCDIPADTSNIAYYEFVCFGDSYPNGYDYRVVPGEFFKVPSYWIQNLGDNLCFRVRAVTGNPLAYNSSPWVTCDTFYVPPEGLAAPTDLQWDGKTMTWNWIPAEGQEGMALRYLIDVYYTPALGEEPVLLNTYGTKRMTYAFENWAESIRSAGYYSFAVTAVSIDQDVIPNSKPSAMSEALYVEPAPALPMPSNVRCDGAVITWDCDLTEDQERYTEYEVLVFKAGQQYDITGYWTGMESCVIPGQLFAQIGAGEYIFTVRAVSRNPERYSNSYSVRASGSFVYAPAEAPVEMTAQKENGALAVTVDLEINLPVQAFCTVYDQDGRLLDTRILHLTEVGWEEYVTMEGTQTVTLDCGGEEAYLVKLFLLSPGDNIPIYAPAVIPVT